MEHNSADSDAFVKVGEGDEPHTRDASHILQVLLIGFTAAILRTASESTLLGLHDLH